MNKLIASHNSDITKILQLIADAQNWLKNQGVDQWQDGYPNRTLIEKDIQLNQSFLFISNEKTLIATVVISLIEEPTYSYIEGHWITQTKNYGVIHRLAVDTQIKHKGIAQSVFEKAEQYCKIQGKISMRIDTHKDNKVMQHIILKRGYQYCGIIHISDGTQRLAYEKLL